MQPRFYQMINTDISQIGFIAQEMEQIVPEVVSGDDGRKGLSYGHLTAVIVNALKQMNDVIDFVNIPEGFGPMTIDEEGVLIVDKLRAEKIRAKKIEIEDSLTGEPYCVTIENGEWAKVLGICE